LIAREKKNWKSENWTPTSSVVTERVGKNMKTEGIVCAAAGKSAHPFENKGDVCNRLKTDGAESVEE
jgi:hypothetical protein